MNEMQCPPAPNNGGVRVRFPHYWGLGGFFLLAFCLPTLADVVKDAHRPNVDLYVYRRSYTPDEKVPIRLSAYNEPGVGFTLYRLDFPSLVPNSSVLADFKKPIQALDLSRLHSVRSWTYAMGKIYPDQWAEREVSVLPLPPGVYLIRAFGGGAEKRTWFDVTGIALLAKQSRQELLVYAASAHSGQPVTGFPLTLTDERGQHWRGATDQTGVWHLPNDKMQGNVWIYGERSGEPAFALSSPPPTPDPYTVYAFTDRPIYRPSQKVLYKGTIRARLDADAPGGFVYQPYANKKATVEVRDATDALISRQEVTTNAYGSFDGTLQLASEPTLGRWQIVVSIGEFRSYANFDVQAYRKPEFTASVHFDKAHYVGSATVPVTISGQYYFGQPVARAAVQYNISFSGSGNAEPAYNGQGVTDAKGELHLDIRTQRLPFDRTLDVSATLTDLSRRSQQAEGDTLIQGGLFHLSLETDKSVYRPGDKVIALVSAADYDGKPVATKAKVRLIETLYDRDNRPYTQTSTQTVVTNAAGNGKVAFPLARPGSLQLEAIAFDEDDNKIEADSSVWVAGDDYPGYVYPTLNLVSDRENYRPGEVATLLLNTNLITPKNALPTRDKVILPIYHQAWALVTVEGERLYRQEVVPITARSTTLRLPLTDLEFPSVSVNVEIIQEKQIYQQEVRLNVERDQQKLQVSVSPDKDTYQPGETATYTVTTRDYLGRPTPAEVSLGVVDASIYAIEQDTTPDIRDYFYSGQQVRVQTDFSFAAQYSGGAYQNMAAQTPSGANAKANIRVRRQFADTAYWNPSVITNNDGVGKVSFTVPDNLTTWRATARGLTLGTAAGAGNCDAIATMPFLVRLALPRFYVQDDEAVISAIVHNFTGTTRTVQTKITVTGAELTGDAVRTFTLPPGEQRLTWSARITDPANVRFLVSADGGAGAQDAIEMTLPSAPDGLKMIDSQTETLTSDTAAYTQDIEKLPPGATVTLSLAPSVASSMFDALDYLTSYPYGCAEQTTSAFLPDVIAARALKHLGVNHQVNPNLEQWVSLGLQKLYRYQHGDGGWNWWEFDQTDGAMTSYVLYGLLQAREAGYVVDDQRILRGTEELLRLLNDEQELSVRADYLLTLSYARPEAIAEPLKQLYDKREKLDAYGQASLCLALAQAGGKLRPLAETLAQELAAKAIVRGTTVHWSSEEGGYSWGSDDVEVTARVLRALLAATPGSPRIVPAIRWLMGNRQGKAWDNTRDSAEAVFALASYMEQTHEIQPNFHAQVLLDGQPVKEVAETAANVFDPPATVTLTPDQLSGHHTLSATRQGMGTLYLTATQTYLLPPDQAKPQAKGIAVHRLFTVTAEDPTQADTLASGSEMDVQVEVLADSNYRYAILEDPLPAGCEVISGEDTPDGSYPIDFSEGSAGYTRMEVQDNKIVFFFDSLAKGKTQLTYRLRTETPGYYHILPSIASLVYFPEIRGNSGLVTTRIGERP